MHLSHLVYASRSVDVDDLAVGNILRAARQNNRAQVVTGVLLFDGTHFLQLLEGDRDVLSSLFRTISADPRHADVTLMSVGSLQQRDCHGWAMGYLDEGPVVTDAVQRFSASRAFDPYDMSSESAAALLRHIARHESGVAVTDPI